MTTSEWVSAVIAALGFISGIVGLIFGVRANRNADRSQEIANRALEKAAEAQAISAGAQTDIARTLARATAPPPRVVNLRLRRGVSKDRYELVNAGSADALSVNVAGVPIDRSNLIDFTPDRFIEAGSAIPFMVMRRLSLSIDEIDVTWFEDGDEVIKKKRLVFP